MCQPVALAELLEGDDDIAWRKNLLRQIGYKL
jgi:adenosine/AMP kinase